MQTTSPNPLSRHFRQPAIHLKLPSGGKFYPDGALNLPVTGAIPVYPMTVKDELTLKTPDALLTGVGMVDVVKSCCPNILDPWSMPTIDIDPVFIAIRIASYGQMMDIDTICPNESCKHENNHQLDLSAVLDQIRAPNYNATVDMNGLKIKLKPQSYFEANKINMTQFEENRLMEIANNEEMNKEEKLSKFNEHMQRLVTINIEMIAAGTEYIETEDGTQVSNFDHLKEFYDNADNKFIRVIRDRFEMFAKNMELPKPNVVCEECSTQYPIAVEFDYTRFFGDAS